MLLWLRLHCTVTRTWTQPLNLVWVVLMAADDRALLGFNSIHLEARVLLKQVTTSTCSMQHTKGGSERDVAGFAKSWTQ